MDIYSFISFRDVAEHCRIINKTWNTFEMLVIIKACYTRSMPEKHAALQELIDRYPDMSVMLHDVNVRGEDEIHVESIHKKLAEIIELERRDPEHRATPVKIGDNFFHWSLCYVDIPVPFKRGDILGNSSVSNRENALDYCFVLDCIGGNEKQFAELTLSSGKYLTGYKSNTRGFFVDDDGTLYGDWFHHYETCEYYKGKLEEQRRLLHYVSLFIKNEIGLPKLLNRQCRIAAEALLDNFPQADI